MKQLITLRQLALVLLFNVIITVTSLAQNQEFTVPLSDPNKRGKLKAHLNSGSITVKGTARKDVLVRYTTESDNDDDDRDDMKIDVKVKVKVKGYNNNNEDNNNNNNEDKDEDKETSSRDGLRKVSGGGVDLEVTESENVVKATSDSWNNEMNLEIEVPSGFDLQVETYNNGELTVSNIQGTLELTNYNDEITALNISGSVVATTYNGGIKVTFDKVTEGTPMSFSTYNGDIETIFPPAIKNSFKVKTEQGDVYSNFDVDFRSTGPIQKKESKPGAYKVIVDEWKRGDVNGGGAEITMRNYHGDIIIRKK
jgi:hypothetical protein